MNYNLYTEEQNIPESMWNRYLQKYESKYKLKREQDTGCWGIVCKFGNIEPYGIKQELLVYCGSYPSPRAKAGFLSSNSICKQGFLEIKQEGDSDICIVFPESRLSEVEKQFKIKKKRQLSEATKAKLIANLAKIRKKK